MLNEKDIITAEDAEEVITAVNNNIDNWDFISKFIQKMYTIHNSVDRPKTDGEKIVLAVLLEEPTTSKLKFSNLYTLLKVASETRLY